MNKSIERPQRVALIGAYDRFNYGDLLFPLIAAKEIAAQRPDTEVEVYSLRQSDLSRYGALPTKSIRGMFDGSFLRDGDVCIVNGGGVLGVDWVYIYANTIGPMGNNNLRRLERVLGQSTMDRCIRWAFGGGRACAPFVIRSSDFDQRIKVVYNAVGGGAEVMALPAGRRSAVLESLRHVDFMSVRDDETVQALAGVTPAVLAPDSAIVMSTHYPVDSLPPTSGPGGAAYMCVQANADFGRLHSENIIAMVEGAYRETGLPAVLLPIGRYTGLDDHEFLVELSGRLRTPHSIFSAEATVHEIMAVIARAHLFVGTSLHGQVTSQSFTVPHLGLGLKNPKLVSYLHNWGLPASAKCLDPTDVPAALQAIRSVLAVPKQDYVAQRDKLISQSRANFTKMFVAAGLL